MQITWQKKVKGTQVHNDVRLDRLTKKFVNTVDDLGFNDANHKLNQQLQYRHSKEPKQVNIRHGIRNKLHGSFITEYRMCLPLTNMMAADKSQVPYCLTEMASIHKFRVEEAHVCMASCFFLSQICMASCSPELLNN